MKTELLDLIQMAEREIDVLIDQLDPVDREDSGSSKKWTAKMHLAHVGEWGHRMIAHLKDPSLPEPPVPDVDAENEAIYQQYRSQSWEQVCSFVQSVLAEARQQVEKLSEQDLQSPDLLANQNNRPLWRLIAGNFHTHTILHLSYIYIDCGQPASALRLFDEATGPTLALDTSPDWQGVTLYNLACNYALVGDTDKALGLLTQALASAPDLIPWAKQDSDLNNLHGMVRFEELLNQKE